MGTLDLGNPKDFIDFYLVEMINKVEINAKTTMCDSQLLKFVGDLFVAGTETTSVTLLWALIFLVRHPEVQQTICNEIATTLGKRSQLCIADEKNMPYTAAVIMETQRLGDIAPFSLLHCNFDTVHLDRYTIPAGTIVIPCLNSVHMDPLVWDEPKEFKPSRFLNENGSLVNRKELMPFCIGQRMCPGSNLAKMEIFLTITSVVRRFEIRQAQFGELPALEGHVGVTHMPFPFKLRFIERRGGREANL